MKITITKENVVLPFDCRLDTANSTLPFISEVLEEVESIPGADGEKQLSTRRGPTNWILVMKSAEYPTREQKDALIAQVDKFMARAAREPQKLYYERLGRVYTVRYVGLTEKTREYATWLEFRLTLKAHDPMGYSQSESSTGKTGVIYNRGNEPAHTRMEFRGPLTNPSVTVNGTAYAYAGSVPTGSTLVVDSAKQRVVLRNDGSGAATNASRGWNKKFLVLNPGPEANITQIAAGTDQFMLFWRNTWG